MEKFAVDLDKVLDEFEFNEDREEKLLMVGKRGFTDISPTNDKRILQQELTPSNIQGFEQFSCGRNDAQPINTVQKSVSKSNVLSSVIETNPRNIKGTKDSSSNTKDNSEKYGSSNKFNVSGVFSSLNEYLNAGNVNANVASVDGINNEILYNNNCQYTQDKEADFHSGERETNYSGHNVKESYPEIIYKNTDSHDHSSAHCSAKVAQTVNEGADVTAKNGTADMAEVMGMLEVNVPLRQSDISDVSSQETMTFSDSLKAAEIPRCVSDFQALKNIKEGCLPAKDSLTHVNKGRDDVSPPVVSCTSIEPSNIYVTESDPTGDQSDNENTLSHESASGSSPKVSELVRFSAIEELSDSELDTYLHELEQIYDSEVAGIESDDSDEQSGDTSDMKILSQIDTPNEDQHKSTSKSNVAVSNTNQNYEESGENILSSVTNDSSKSYSEYVGKTCDVTVLPIVSEQENPGKGDCNLHLYSSSVLVPDDRTVIVSTSPPDELSVVDECDIAGNILYSESNLEDQATYIGPPTVTLSVTADTSDIGNLDSPNGEYSSCLTAHNDSVEHVNILNTSKVTASVSNVISIECQQIKRNSLESQVNCEDSTGANKSSLTVDSITDLFKHMQIESSPMCVTGATEVIAEKVLGLTQEQTLSENRNIGTICASENIETSSVRVDASKSAVFGEHKIIAASGAAEDEEKPARPKYLYLPSKIVVADDDDDEEEEEEEEEDLCGLIEALSIGPPGETPSTKCGFTEESHGIDAENVLSSESDSRILPEVPETSPVDLPSSPLPSQLPVNSETGYNLSPEEKNLGKYPPFWVPDADAQNCMLCNMRFSVIKRRHHCRACGKVLCSKCCSLKASLDYMDNAEGRVCHPCFGILAKVFITDHAENGEDTVTATNNDSISTSSTAPLGRQPNPNNPMEYCSTIPPLEQVASSAHQPLPSVLVPVGVLKREGSSRPRSEVTKQVMFSDGIRPGGDLTELDGSSEPRVPYRRQERVSKRIGTPPGTPSNTGNRTLRTLLPLDPNTKSYIPPYKGLPPLATVVKGELRLEEESDVEKLITCIKDENATPATFALNRNLLVQLKIINLNCCVNRTCWCFTTVGMSSVGQDEIIIILECLPNETTVPKDIFSHLNTLYQEASRGRMVSELGHSVLQGPVFLGSTDHGGFIFIRPSFQCLHKIILPPAPFLIGILIHRWETPWAKVFPIRLMLRLGAEFRYYPSMLVSVRARRPVYCEIGHTIINLLADFRNLSYTLPSVRGLVIHMEDRCTSVLLPRNRYDQVTRALNNSNDHVLAFAANFSFSADSHLVCIQSAGDESYHTQAINIHNKPRKVTGASFVVFNGALKASSNLTAKSSIVEDGLMVQITPDTIQGLRAALRNMKDFSISCGPTGVEQPDEVVYIKWVQDDKNFNIGVKSLIDGRPLDGIPSIRVHNGTDYMGSLRFIRWTEVFILQSEETSEQGSDPVDISRLTESVARATCLALINLLDLLAQAGLTKIAVRAMIHPEHVGYEAGSQGEKLPPIYMNSLDNELIPVLHKAASMSQDSPAVILELIFHVMLQ